MPNLRLASRYAKSLLDLAVEKGQLEQVHSDMRYLQQLLQASRDFLNLLRSPIVSAEKKQRIVEAATSGSIGPATATFMRLLIDKARESELPEIIDSFLEQYRVSKNIHTVTLTTATPISEEIKTSIVEQVKKTANIQDIELKTIVDPSIIGGFVLQTGDKLVDASISYELKQIARQFENNDFIYKVR